MTDTSTRKVKRGWMNLKITKIFDETKDTKTFYFVDADEGGRCFDYYAGQYLSFRYDHIQEKPIVRSYTMSSSPCQEDIAAVTVKRVEKGVVSNWMCDHLAVGSILRGRGPIGRFCYEPEKDQKHLAMLAAGSGVTPFISIMREYMHAKKQGLYPEVTMSLLVAFRSTDDIICKQELDQIKEESNFNIHMTFTRENTLSSSFWKGRPDPSMFTRWIEEIGGQSNKTFMTCGPDLMMNDFKTYLLEKNVAEELIKMESFA